MSTTEAPVGVPAPGAAHAGDSRHILPRTAGALEVLAQSVAAAAPAVAIASVPGSIFLVAGNGTLWSLVIGTVVVLLVAFTISRQARHTASSGSLATFTGNGLGPGASFTAAWGLLIGYGGFTVSALVGAWLYAGSFLDDIGFGSSSKAVGAVLVLAALALAVTAAYRGIRLSARLALTLELVSLAFITVVLVGSLVQYGFSIDTNLFTAKGASFSDILLGAVLGVGAFAGFESAASLGLETRNAHRTIARVLLRIVLGLSLLYLVASYSQILGFGTLTGDQAPLHVVADYAGIGWASYVIDLGVAFSMVAFGAAVLNAGARSLYTLGREGALPRQLARVHPRHGSPYVGVLTVGALGGATALAFVLAGTGALTASIYVGTVASYGFFAAYILVSIATPVWLWRRGSLTPATLLAGVAAAAGMVYVVYRNVYPAAAYPYNLLPWIFAGLLALGIAFYAVLRVRSPQRAREIGSVQEIAEQELRESDEGPLHAGAAV